MTEQELYKFILLYLKRQLTVQRPSIQMLGVIRGADQEARFAETGQRDGSGHFLNEQDREQVAGIVWDLVVQRVLTFTSQGYPWIAITEYGKQVIENEGPIPQDMNGFLQNIKEKAEHVSDIALSYAEEAILCFRGGAYRGAAIMLGVASEEVYLDLVRAFENKYQESFIPEKYKPFQQIKDDFLKKFNPKKADLPSTVKKNIEQMLHGIHDLIKKGRDDSGHPTGIEITHEEILANFSVFPLYVERVYQIIDSYGE